MSSAVSNKTFSFKAFAIGLAVTSLLYLCAYLFVTFKADSTLKTLEKKLSSQSVIIEGLNDMSLAPEPEIKAQPLSAADKVPTPTKEEKEVPFPDVPSEQDVADLQELMNVGNPSSSALPRAPINGFFEETADGLLPVKKCKTNTLSSI